jgi:DNA-binding winged helix-turn-helix (wHTH) protein
MNPPVGVAFGRFQVLPDRRELLADGQPIRLGGRAFDVLMALIEGRGAVVGKQALIARVWPGRIIEDNSLAAQIAALRAALGAERALIRTVSGRGYQFTGEIRALAGSLEQGVARTATAEPTSVLPLTNAPKPVSELIGREEELGEILNLVATHRLVTVTGAGGIGKTTLALAVARECGRTSLMACGWPSSRPSPILGWSPPLSQPLSGCSSVAKLRRNAWGRR